MFEHRQDQLEKLVAIRLLLISDIAAAETGTAPMGDMALNQMKKEKLWAKDQLARMMSD